MNECTCIRPCKLCSDIKQHYHDGLSGEKKYCTPDKQSSEYCSLCNSLHVKKSIDKERISYLASKIVEDNERGKQLSYEQGKQDVLNKMSYQIISTPYGKDCSYRLEVATFDKLKQKITEEEE